MSQKSAEIAKPLTSDLHGAAVTKLNGVDGIVVEDGENHRCGLFGCTPGFLQCLHKPSILLLTLMTAFAIQSFCVNGILSASYSTLEKRFGLTSKQSGFLSTVYNVAAVIVIIPMSHYANTGHQGRYIGFGMLLFALGSLIFASPQFLSPPYSTQSSDNAHDLDAKLCGAGTSIQEPSTVSDYAYILMIVGHILHGIGCQPLLILSITYLDENVAQTRLAMYISWLRAAPVFGVIIGFVVGGKALQVYGDFYRVNYRRDTDLTGTHDDRWYGAWWLPFIASAACSVLVAIPLLSFARRLPNMEERRRKDVNQTDDKLEKAFGEQLTKGESSWTQVPHNVWILCVNLPYVMQRISDILNAIMINALLVFLPKLIENVFNVPLDKAPILGGAAVVPASVIGIIVGGLVVTKLKLAVRGCIRLGIVANTIALLFTIVFLLNCQQSVFFGSSAHENATTLTQTCNVDCGPCSTVYQPVCDESTNISYYSPCYAGCTAHQPALSNQTTIEKRRWDKRQRKPKTSWLSCGCSSSHSLKSGMCEERPCWQLYAFLIGFGVMVACMMATFVSQTQLVVRMVPFSQRTLSVSFAMLTTRLFGHIPGALITGAMIDSSCILWNEDPNRRHCIRYDIPTVTRILFGFAMALRIIIILCQLTSLWAYRETGDDVKETEKSADMPLEPYTSDKSVQVAI